MIIIFISSALSIIFDALYYLYNSKIYLKLFCITIGIVVIMLTICDVLNRSKEKLKIILNNHHRIYSDNRMNMLKNIFQKYNLDISNASTIDLLIQEAKDAQIENNPFISINKPAKILLASIISIIAYVAKEIAKSFTTNELMYITLLVITIIFCIIAIITVFIPAIINIIYYDYSKYDELIYDLRQLKIFYR